MALMKEGGRCGEEVVVASQVAVVSVTNQQRSGARCGVRVLVQVSAQYMRAQRASNAACATKPAAQEPPAQRLQAIYDAYTMRSVNPRKTALLA